jgi:hypothetical protein
MSSSRRHHWSQFNFSGRIVMQRRQFIFGLTSTSATMLFPRPATAAVFRGRSIITLQCLGALRGLNSYYLDGRTVDGSVGLAPNDQLSGTRWRVRERPAGSGIVILECLGNIRNPNHRFLDGHTVDGSVGLAPGINPPFTGTRWQIYETDTDMVTLQCLGKLEGLGSRWLDGRTQNSSVGLAPATIFPFSGTSWSVASPSVRID